MLKKVVAVFEERVNIEELRKEELLGKYTAKMLYS